MGSKRKFQRATGVVSSTINEEVMLLHIERGHYYGVESVAGQIWQLLEESMTIGELCKMLQLRYQVSEAVCESDVDGFLQELLSEDLVVSLDKLE